jgi:hypothetical protein
LDIFCIFPLADFGAKITNLEIACLRFIIIHQDNQTTTTTSTIKMLLLLSFNKFSFSCFSS